MPDALPRSPIPDRLQVFISSTIGECEAERASARRAVIGLNFEPIQFEREGARAEAPRDFYLRKLQGSHVVVGIYRNSYGWVDETNRMKISGLEDEYREASRLGKDLLAYVLKTAPERDARLSVMLDELKAGSHTIYFFDGDEDLESRIRDDLTALVSDRVARFQSLRSGGTTASSVLDSIFRDSPLRVRRGALLDRLTHAAAVARIVWLTGAAGAGKTALAAEWAHERGASYVNARGLDPRSVLIEATRALGLATEPELAVPVFDDARNLLLSRWQQGDAWPLVLDDPDDVDAVWAALSECLAGSGTGSIIVVARQVASSLPGEHFEVTGFSEEELVALRSITGLEVTGATAGELPLALRRAQHGATPVERFEILDAASREILGYLALSPTPLALEDLLTLLGGSVASATELTDRIGSLAAFLMDAPSGFTFVHDLYRENLAENLNARPQLKALLTSRLSKRLARTGRAWAAFTLRRGENSELAERLANRAVREAVFTGSTRHLVDALEYLAAYYRSRGERGPLVSVLMSLADARGHQGKPDDAPQLLDEALSLAMEMGDEEASRAIEILQASIALRRSASRTALERVRELRQTAEADGRSRDQGRLLLEEGTALLGANETEAAIPIFRDAREIFARLEDTYGVEIATRNLVVSLSTTPGGVAESERLRAELGEAEVQSPRYRAWLCNLLVPRLRRDKRFAEAEAMAREAIEIGTSLGDQYLVAINSVVLGNVLREAGRAAEAIEAYTVAGRTAQTIGRPDLEGRSSRLLALTENGAAEAASGSDRREHGERAEHYATHAAGIFSNSFAWSEYAYALEERGDARRLLDREHDAIEDYADAVATYLQTGDESEAERLLRNLTSLIEDTPDRTRVIARAFGSKINPEELGPSGAWVQALIAALDGCPKTVAPNVLGVLVRAFYPGGDGAWWFHCLVRCLLVVNRERKLGGRRAIGPLLLLAILGFGRHREFTIQELLTLAGLCIGDTDEMVIRHRPGGDLLQIIRLGKDGRVLFTIRDEAQRPEATFVSLCIGSFLDAFGDELTAIIFGDGLTEGAALDVTVFAQAAESAALADFLEEGLKDKPVATARIMRKGGEEAPIILFARADAIRMLQARPDRGGELEVMLARFLEEVVHATVGSSLDDEIYSSKVRDLLMQVLR